MRKVLIVLALCSGGAFADDKSYMQLVGELLGSVESPRIVRDYCAQVSPSTAAFNAATFEKWRQRNWTLLQSVEEQRRRADVRLKTLGYTAARPTDAIYSSMKAKLLDRFNGYTKDQQAKLCGGYASLIQKKDEEAKEQIPKLLGVVAEADAALAAREKK